MSYAKLNFRQFKLSDMVDHPAILTIGKRGSGKSVLIKTILKHYKNIPAGIVICPTDRLNDSYSEWYPKSFIYD